MYPSSYKDEDIAWLKENYEPEYMQEVRRRNSAKTTRYLTDDEAIQAPGKDPILRYNKDRLAEIGDKRLVVLYECFSDFEEAARRLNIRVSTLRSHIRRLRIKFISLNIDPLNFDRLVRCK